MVTNPEQKEDEESAHEEAEEFIRTVVAGHPQGALRRIVLYLLLGAFMMIGVYVDGGLGILSAIFGLTALLLLAMTDQLA